MYDVVILAAGKLEQDLREKFDAESKAYIPLKDRMMVQYVIGALRDVPKVMKIVMAVPSNNVPGGLDSMVDGFCLGGVNMMDSLKNALELCNTEYVLVLPCDVPLISTASINDFLNKCSTRSADFYYSFVSRDSSEKLYPDLHHTYVRLKEGIFCGGSLALIRKEQFPKGEALFRSLSNARKNILGLATKLGLITIIKFLLHKLTVPEVEVRISKMLGASVAGILSEHAEMAFNVDDISVFDRAVESL